MRSRMERKIGGGAPRATDYNGSVLHPPWDGAVGAAAAARTATSGRCCCALPLFSPALSDSYSKQLTKKANDRPITPLCSQACSVWQFEHNNSRSKGVEACTAAYPSHFQPAANRSDVSPEQLVTQHGDHCF